MKLIRAFALIAPLVLLACNQEETSPAAKQLASTPERAGGKSDGWIADDS